MKIGDKVEWTSQAGSHHKTKTGVIVEVVAPGQRPNRERFETLYRGSGCGWGRKTESYVVNTGHPARAPKYYWPVQSLLRQVA
jgi:hypothetical protein